ncbi:MAG: hypothetical protein Q8Q52_01740, partial [Acidimicrobiia bacterium]|nr:hypothetical protein [Acidimicrobiia bacterium]
DSSRKDGTFVIPTPNYPRSPPRIQAKGLKAIGRSVVIGTMAGGLLLGGTTAAQAWTFDTQMYIPEGHPPIITSNEWGWGLSNGTMNSEWKQETGDTGTAPTVKPVTKLTCAATIMDTSHSDLVARWDVKVKRKDADDNVVWVDARTEAYTDVDPVTGQPPLLIPKPQYATSVADPVAEGWLRIGGQTGKFVHMEITDTDRIDSMMRLSTLSSEWDHWYARMGDWCNLDIIPGSNHVDSNGKTRLCPRVKTQLRPYYYKLGGFMWYHYKMGNIDESRRRQISGDQR